MTKLKRASYDDEQAEQLAREMFKKWEEGDPLVRQAIHTINRNKAKDMICDYLNSELFGSDVWKNETYQVAVRDHDGLVHLSIKRIDKQSIHDWRDLQEIKNQLVGEESEGVELYPAESRKVDTANQYHIWVVKDPKYRFPFGFYGRFVTESPLGNSVNRPL